MPYWSNGYDVCLPNRRTRFNSGVRYNAVLEGRYATWNYNPAQVRVTAEWKVGRAVIATDC